MSTFFIKSSQIDGELATIIGDDANHLKNVLRFKIGDELDICDENEKRYKTVVKEFCKDNIILHVIEQMEHTTESPINITLFQGLPKAEKMDIIIQKATELGVREIVPIEMERSVVRLYGKDNKKKFDRWNKIAYESAKQCGRQYVPVVQNIDILKNIIEKFSEYDIVLLPYEKENCRNIKQVLQNNTEIKKIAVIIGPEGGFDDKEIQVLKLPNTETVTLGPRILRTETAGMAVLAMLSYEIEFER